MTSDFPCAAGAREAELRAFPGRAWDRVRQVGLVLWLLVVTAVATAQDLPDPFAVQPADQPPPPADTAADQPDAAAPAPPPIDLTQYGPAVQAVLVQERRTPAELLEGVLLLVELGEPELARPWLDALAQAPLEADAQAELARRFGSHRLMRLAREDALGEDARGLANSLMEAYAAQVRAPERLRELIAQLADPTAEVRYAAVAGLVQAGETAAAALVAALDDVQSEDHRTWLQIALAELAPESIGPLLAGLEADAAAIRASSATVLGRVVPGHLSHWLLGPALVDEDPHVRRAASAALDRLFGQAPTPEAAEQILRNEIDEHLQGTRPLLPVHEGHVEIWLWDADSQAPAGIRVEPEQARVYVASRLARNLLSLVPSNLKHREQDTMLQLAAGEFGLPLAEEPRTTADLQGRRQLMLAALQEALRRDLPRAIVGAARALAGTPDGESLLLSHAPAESPLVRALNHPSEAVQWEALAAIMQIDPQSPYPGASRVTKAIAAFIRSGGRPRAVVALPTIEQARNLAATIDRLGYDVSLATSGRQAILAAAASGGADLILVDARIGRPSIREVLYQMRVNPISSGAPIGVLGVGNSLERAREVAADHPGVEAFPHPWELNGGGDFDESLPPPPPAEAEETLPPRVVLDEQAVETILERLARSVRAIAPEGMPSRDERARQALLWLGELLSRDDTFYDVRKYEAVVLEAADHPPLTKAAVTVLAHFGSHESQLRLVDLASSRIVPVELRGQAAEAFRASARRYGVQLTTSEILRQYGRYNASETADRPTQQVLGHVLDTIEMKRLQTAGE